MKLGKIHEIEQTIQVNLKETLGAGFSMLLYVSRHDAAPITRQVMSALEPRLQSKLPFTPW